MYNYNTIEDIIKTVEAKVRERFILGSHNRIEDFFDWETCVANIITENSPAVEATGKLTDAIRLNPALSAKEKIQGYYTLIIKHNLRCGNCGAQAWFALGEYLIIQFTEKIALISAGEHAFLRIGTWQDGWVHDPHGHEYYPAAELSEGGHHANRYFEQKNELKVTLEFTFPTFNHHYFTQQIVRPAQFWRDKKNADFFEGEKFYKQYKWLEAKSHLERSLSLQLNLSTNLQDKAVLYYTFLYLIGIYRQLRDPITKIEHFTKIMQTLLTLPPKIQEEDLVQNLATDAKDIQLADLKIAKLYKPIDSATQQIALLNTALNSILISTS